MDGVGLAKGAGIDVPSAWRMTKGERDVVICVADDGFDLTHPGLGGPRKVVEPMNVGPKGAIDLLVGSNVMPRPGDRHGTPCAGVAVAENDFGAGVVGVAPGCALMPVRFPMSLNDAQIGKLFDLVSPHADVISCSWG